MEETKVQEIIKKLLSFQDGYTVISQEKNKKLAEEIQTEIKTLIKESHISSAFKKVDDIMQERKQYALATLLADYCC